MKNAGLVFLGSLVTTLISTPLLAENANPAGDYLPYVVQDHGTQANWGDNHSIWYDKLKRKNNQ